MGNFGVKLNFSLFGEREEEETQSNSACVPFNGGGTAIKESRVRKKGMDGIKRGGILTG